MTTPNNDPEIVDFSVALEPCDLDRVPSLVEKIVSLSKGLSAGDHGTRLDLLAQVQSLTLALETPRETMMRHLWGENTVVPALTIGVDSGLWAHMARDNGSPKKAVDVAEVLGFDPDFLCRIMKHVAAMGYLVEVGPDEYKPTNFTRCMSNPILGDGYPTVLEITNTTLSRLPGWLKQSGYKPPSATEGVFQQTHNTTLNFFEYMRSQPRMAECFAHHMAAYSQGRASWMDPDFYPVHERLVLGAETDNDPAAVFLVDIGGSIGHDIAEFSRKHPIVPGRLVLQDMPHVINGIAELDPKIEKMPYDFLTEQPIKGARAYYLHSVLHDWDDDKCRQILARVTAAMKPGYSKLLVYENVIPSTGADWQVTGGDLVMCAVLGSKERSEREWHELLEGAGLRICKIWNAVNGVESLIECELA